MMTMEPDLETLDRLLGPELVELLEELEDRRGELDGLPLVPDAPEGIERREDLEVQCQEAESEIALLVVRTRQRLRRDPERIAALIDANGGFA